MQKTLKILLLIVMCAAACHAAPRYTALGASDAIGTGSSKAPAMPNGGYVFLISDWLDARYAPWTLHNLGASGYTAPDIRDNTLDRAIADKPDIVTVWVGGNDVKNSFFAKEDTATLVARFQPAYTAILARLRNETDAFIVTANLPDFSRIPFASYFGTDLRAKLKADSDALNEVITSVAAANNVPVVDLYADPASYDPANYSSDRFHPNDSGYAAMASQFETVLKDNAWRLVSGLGDVDGDGEQTAADAGATLQIAAGLLAPDDREAVAADTFPPGGDGAVSVEDAVHTLRRALGLVPAADWK